MVAADGEAAGGAAEGAQLGGECGCLGVLKEHCDEHDLFGSGYRDRVVAESEARVAVAATNQVVARMG